MKLSFFTDVFLFLLLCTILLLDAGHVNSQEIDFNSYRVGPGDILSIKVWDHEDLNRVIEVSQEGTISFPFIGQVNVLEQSVYEIENLLAHKLGQGYIVAPQVAISINQYNNKKVFLFGEVNRPGKYPLKGNISLLELISEAGGFTDKLGTVCKIVRTGQNGFDNVPIAVEDAKPHEIITIDINELTSGRLSENIILLPGDSIYINAADHLFVTGEVRRPGEVKWNSGLTVRQAISSAGGGTPGAAVGRTKILRIKNGRETEIKPGLSDPVLPNDIIKVPQSYF